MVTITDQGSKTHEHESWCKVSQPKVSLNTGAEITIRAGKLFRKVASTNCLKKRDLKPSNKTHGLITSRCSVVLRLTDFWENDDEDNGLHQDGRHFFC